MAGRWYPHWQPEPSTRIWVVRDGRDDRIVAVAVIRPWDQNFLVDQFEVEWKDGRATWSGLRAAPLMKEFFREFKKESGLRLYSLVMDDNKRHSDIIEKRGYRHVAGLWELE